MDESKRDKARLVGTAAGVKVGVFCVPQADLKEPGVDPDGSGVLETEGKLDRDAFSVFNLSCNRRSRDRRAFEREGVRR